MTQKYTASNGLRVVGLGLVGGMLLWWGLRRRHMREMRQFSQFSPTESSARTRTAAPDRAAQPTVSSSITETAWANAEPPTESQRPEQAQDRGPARGEALADLAGSASSQGWEEQRRLEQPEGQESARGEALADLAGSASSETWHEQSRSPEPTPGVEPARAKAPVTEETAKSPKAGPGASEDLTPIEGIGPKINQVLHDAGIATFAQLAETEVSRLQQILSDANIRLANADTWPEQAKLAAVGDWDELERLKDELDAGVRR